MERLTLSPKALLRGAKVLHAEGRLGQPITGLGRKLGRKVHYWRVVFASLPAQLAHQCCQLSWVEARILAPRYRQACEAHRPNLPILDAVETAIVEQLDHDGICVTSLETLQIPRTAEFLETALQLGERLQQQRSSDPDAYQILASAEDFKGYPLLFEWGLGDRFLKIVESYLGLAVAYDGVSGLLSMANGIEREARAWHCDREDRRMVKVCVYLNDVDETGGPFECMPPHLNEWLGQTVPSRYADITERQMQQWFTAAELAERVSCTGPKGTVIFVDTARFFHRGKPPTHCDRQALFFHYFSCRPWHPFFCHRTPFVRKQEVIQPLTLHQQACVNWYQSLPLVAKLIPRSHI